MSFYVYTHARNTGEVLCLQAHDATHKVIKGISYIGLSNANIKPSQYFNIFISLPMQNIFMVVLLYY